MEDVVEGAVGSVVKSGGNGRERDAKSNAACDVKSGADGKQDGKGRKDAEIVFNWLRENKVQKVIEVTVEDNMKDPDATPHSDGSIEAALKGLDVEVWNWKKMDISIATIRNAAPNVRKVYLYSSGNNAVLQGWSDTRGLVTLTKVRMSDPLSCVICCSLLIY